MEQMAHSALPCWCSPPSRNSCFLSSVARLPVCLTAASSLSYSASSEEHSQQLAQAAPFTDNDRFPVILEMGISSIVSVDTASHVAALDTIEKQIERLELVLMQTNEECYRNDLFSDEVLLETQSKYNTVKEELCRLQTLLDSKENSLNISRSEATELKALLQETEVRVASLNLYKEAKEGSQAEELLRYEKSSCNSLEILNRHFLAIEAISNVQEKVQKVWESIVSSHCSLDYMMLINILQNEASLSFETLLMATTELEQEKAASQNLLSRYQKSVEDVKERGLHISRLQHELANANQETDMVSKVLARSETEVSCLHKKLINAEGLLEKERRALRAARDGLDKLDQALGNEESKVDDLFKVVSSLKAQLEQKEQIVVRLTDELLGLKETARTHLDALSESEKKVEQLTLQCGTLEDKIRSRDMLLDEIKNEAVKSTEALKLAAQIKQDLNLSKQREVQLTQDWERESLKVKDLNRELMENSRAVRAELALQQAEKEMNDLSRELILLKKGIQSRDDVIKLMEEKLEGNIHLLKSASNDRETLRKMQFHIESLESKLREFMFTP